MRKLLLLSVLFICSCGVDEDLFLDYDCEDYVMVLIKIEHHYDNVLVSTETPSEHISEPSCDYPNTETIIISVPDDIDQPFGGKSTQQTWVRLKK